MQPVADMAAFFNIPILGWLTTDHRLDNKTRVSTLVRVMAPVSTLGSLLLDFCRRFRWTRLALISSQGPVVGPLSDYFRDLLTEDEELTLIRHFPNVSRNSSDDAIVRRLQQISEVARIVFLVVPEAEVRRYLLAAYDLGMTSGDYQFINIRPYISDDNEIDRMTSQGSWRWGDGQDDSALEAFRSLLIVTFSYIKRWDVDYVQAESITSAMFQDYGTAMPAYAEPNRYSRFLHDSVYLYGVTYNHTMSLNITPTGENIRKYVSSVHALGLTGEIRMDRNGDRLPQFLMWDLGPDLTFRVVMDVNYNRLSNGTTIENLTEVNDIFWGNGNTYWGGYIPPAIPPCGFSNELCPKDQLLQVVLPSVLVTAVVGGVLVSFAVYKWWKKEQDINRQNWRINWEDIAFTPASALTKSQVYSNSNASSHSGSVNSFQKASTTPDKTNIGAKMMKAVKPLTAAANLSVNNSSATTSGVVSLSEANRPFCPVAYLRGTMVALRTIRKQSFKLDRRMLEEMQELHVLRHNNLAMFYGACLDPQHACVLWEYCTKGSLEDILQNDSIKLDTMFQFSMAMDIAAGLEFIHSSKLKVHGNLKSSNCLVDSRWTCKLSGFGMRSLLKGEAPLDANDENYRYTSLLWTAPENVRRVLKGQKRQNTAPADVYALAIILKEILCKNAPYEDEMFVLHMTAKDIVLKVALAEGETYFRPMMGSVPAENPHVMKAFVGLIQACWAEDPDLRPPARRLLRLMKKLNPSQASGMMDLMLQRLEKYSARLEEVVTERTAQLAEEKQKTDVLLYRMLPQKVADDLKSGKNVQAEMYPSVTVYFSDIVGFTEIASSSSPLEIIDLLNHLYTVFDNTIQEFDVYKVETIGSCYMMVAGLPIVTKSARLVETIGDAYMVVSGIPVSNGLRHATVMADMSLSLLEAVSSFTVPHQPGVRVMIRIGLNTGPVVAGVVGNIMPRYCLFGDTVNLASRMESHGEPLKIQLSPFTYKAIEDKSRYVIRERGEIDVKGKGRMTTYWLEGKAEPDNGETKKKALSTLSQAPLLAAVTHKSLQFAAEGSTSEGKAKVLSSSSMPGSSQGGTQAGVDRFGDDARDNGDTAHDGDRNRKTQRPDKPEVTDSNVRKPLPVTKPTSTTSRLEKLQGEATFLY